MANNPVAPKRPQRRLGWLVGLLCCLIVLATLCLSRPSRAQQLEAVNDAARSYVSNRVDSLGLDSLPVFGNIMSEGAKWAGNDAMKSYLDSNYTYHDYLLWTTGTLRLEDGKERRVAVGLLGHTFVSDEAEIGQAMVAAMQKKVGDTLGGVVSTLLRSLLLQP